MKKLTLALVTLSVLALPVMAFAQTGTNTTTGTGANPTGITISNFGDLIGRIETFMWLIFGGIAVIMFVIAGITFLTAQGDPEKVGTARSAFIWGVAGIVVAIVAYSILAIVSSIL